MYRKTLLFLSAIFLTSCGCSGSTWLGGGHPTDLGYGFTLHVDKTQKENNSSLGKLRLNYNGIGFSLNKVHNKDAFQFNVFCDNNLEQEEGRAKKVAQILFPAIIGMKLVGLAAIAIVGTSVFVLKALTVSKLALVSAAGLLIAKLFRKTKVDHGLEHLPEYQPASFPTHGQTEIQDDNNYFNYVNYHTGKDVAVGAASGQYDVIVPSNGTASQTNLQIAKRRDTSLHRTPLTYLTFRKYSID